MKTGFLITARLKSTRLPKKLLREICRRPILAHMLDRIKLSTRVDEIIICTSTHPQDDLLVELARAERVACFRGDEDDVVKRLYDASETFGLEYVLNITADCPFVDPVYSDHIVEAYASTKADLVRAWDLPHGVYAYGINPSALKRILEVKDTKDSEVWVRYFTDTDLFSVYDLPIENSLHSQPHLRMTLDYPEDLEFFENVFAYLYRPGSVFSLDEILEYLRCHPEVVAINQSCAAKYKSRWTKQSALKLKKRYEVGLVGVIGCGSIGQRHIRNLRSLGVSDIVALRTREGHAQELDRELGVREVGAMETLIEAKPDVVIVSNPSSLHLRTAEQLVPHVRGLFIEKPLASGLQGVQAFLEQVKEHRVVSFIGYSLQFHDAIMKVQDLLAGEELGKALVFQCQAGQWLPDWHPYEEYRRAYYARKDLGGGVALTLSHEIHLALELLGQARAVACLLPRSDLLPLDVDVITDVMVEHMSGAVSQIHLDYIQRPAHRCGIVSCERGWIQYDLLNPKVLLQTEKEMSPHIVWEDPDYNTNRSYLREMEMFLKYVSEGRVRHEFDVWRGTRSLAVVDAALMSSRSASLSEVPDWVRDLSGFN